MNIDESEEKNPKNSDALRKITATSIAKLSGSSRIIPSNKDFHFYNNFPEFKKPVQETDKKSKSLLEIIGKSENLLGKVIKYPDDRDVELDDDVAVDWLMNVNDEIFERVDMSLDDFKRLRKKEEESGVRMMRVDGDDDLENGFQMVYGKKNKKSLGSEIGMKGVEEVKVAVKVKPKVPFHIPTIPRPQDEYKIIVNNSNQPFEHVWLQKSEDGSKFIHPLEKFSVLDFIDKSESTTDPVKPPPIETTPFKFVEEVKDLKQLAVKLRGVDEFAVDLEHNQYRSFQGLTCLMQISTRTEDFVIDTLKLRIHVGPYLRDLFRDPTKRKVMHGADRDIVWLQRDFGIYICNMFDTGQASRVLKLERYSLEYLLNHFCGVAANKEYQNADWRLRPLPHEMIKYVFYQNYFLLWFPCICLLNSVYKRSCEICTQLYEKELLTDSSYLHIYGLHGTELTAQQLAVVSGLCEWRDVVARAEDESTGYVLPNRTLIEIARHMPLTARKLRHVLKSKHPYIERNLDSVVSIIKHSIQNADAFEETAEYLKEKRLEMANMENTLTTEESELLPSEAPEILKNAEEVVNINSITLPNDLMSESSLASIKHDDESQDIGCSNDRVATNLPELSHCSPAKDGNEKSVEVTVQALKKPSRAFGALLGSSAKRKFDSDKRIQEETKLGYIKSTVSLPFHTFLGTIEHLQSDVKESAEDISPSKDISAPTTGSALEDIIGLDDDSDAEESVGGESEAACKDQLKQQDKNEDLDDPMSLSDLSSSLEKCSTSVDKTKSSKVVKKSQPLDAFVHVKPFDYEAARKEVIFGKYQDKNTEESDGNNRSRLKKKSVVIQSPNDAGITDVLPQGRRRQAFPASGNRSATFR
ncbi:hypothetical protein RD792_010966 [Penstemon davidsonii]|uniref:HRDC domain-containing protein n=1 Tax=Penstemon davidsonii TaxID=160366 RepID=A0ABR0D4P5_9LAMI|nr:hypothetical protein RD792_010966 [Penstemon davidsonii]